MICEDVRAAMGSGEVCEETDAGARVVTHCLYPSFEPVELFVTKIGEGYRVTDGGRAVRSVWNHGRPEKMADRLLDREAARYHLKVSGSALVAEVPSISWLRAAILATANGSAAVAHAAVAKVAAASESVLKERIFIALSGLVRPESIGADYEIVGTSGDTRTFDYGVKPDDTDTLLVVSAVAPHHSSVYAKYAAFGDTQGLGPSLSRFAVFGKPLATGDVSLMLQVTDDLMPIAALNPKARRALASGERVH